MKSTDKKTEETKKKDSKTTKSKSKTKAKSNAAKDLKELFEDALKDIYWAEKALTKALPKMAKNATSNDLIEALNNHLSETEEHINRLEKVFEIIGKKATAKKCDAMAGLIEEGKSILKETEAGDVRDAGIIAASQKIEHYEIATYGTLRQFAETLGLNDAATILEKTLEDEKNADEKLTIIAVNTVNVDASEKEE